MSNNPYWTQCQQAYIQQCIIAPTKQAPDNARMAIWTFSKPLVLEAYHDGQWQTPCKDGRYFKGKPTLVPFCGTVQPVGANDFQVQQLKEGVDIEGAHCLHIDPHQPENIASAQNFPELFPDGCILITGPDDECQGRRKKGHADVVRFNGCRWKVLDGCRIAHGGRECDGPNAGPHRFILGLYRDRDGELNATPDTARENGRTHW